MIIVLHNKLINLVYIVEIVLNEGVIPTIHYLCRSDNIHVTFMS